MAKMLLWLFVVVAFIGHVVNHFQGEPTQVFTKIFLLSALGVLAICEAIEKRGE